MFLKIVRDCKNCTKLRLYKGLQHFGWL